MIGILGRMGRLPFAWVDVRSRGPGGSARGYN
jgi:hypothetical protein